MKKLIVISIAVLISCIVTGCNTNRHNADPTPAPTGNATFFPEASKEAEVPTETPAPEPTATPEPTTTPEPTAIPKATELDFDSCSELVLRLPWGNGEDEVFIKPVIPGSDGDDWEIPQHFNIIGGKVYIFDRYAPFGSGILKYDTETGELTRLSPDIGDNAFINSEFAVMDGKLIFSSCMFDLATGECIEFQPIPGTPARRDGVLIMNVRDGKCFAYRAVNWEEGGPGEFLFTEATYAYDEFELDMENRAWVQNGRIRMPEYVPHADPPSHNDYTEEVLEAGAVTTMDGEDWSYSCYDRYMGTDDAGNHYVDSEEKLYYRDTNTNVIISRTTWRRIIKFSPDGTPISYVDVYLPDDYIERFWGNYLIFKVDGDGTVWYMCETEAEFLIYKISL